MKNIFFIISAMILACAACQAQSPRQPINRGILQSDMDGNGYAITNVTIKAGSSNLIWNTPQGRVIPSVLGYESPTSGTLFLRSDGYWVPVSGGSGITNAGSIAYQNSNAVNVTGGSISVSNVVITSGGDYLAIGGATPSLKFITGGITNSALGFGSLALGGLTPSITLVSGGNTNFNLGYSISGAPFLRVQGNNPSIVMADILGTTNFIAGMSAGAIPYIMLADIIGQTNVFIDRQSGIYIRAQSGSSPSMTAMVGAFTNVFVGTSPQGGTVMVGDGSSLTNVFISRDILRLGAGNPYMSFDPLSGFKFDDFAANRVLTFRGAVFALHQGTGSPTNFAVGRDFSGNTFMRVGGEFGEALAGYTNSVGTGGGLFSHRYFLVENGSGGQPGLYSSPHPTTASYLGFTNTGLGDYVIVRPLTGAYPATSALNNTNALLTVQMGHARFLTTNYGGVVVLSGAFSGVFDGIFTGSGSAVTNIQTNNIVGLGSYINRLAYPLSSNPSNYITTNTLGSIAYQNSNAVNVTGGSVFVSNLTVSDAISPYFRIVNGSLTNFAINGSASPLLTMGTIGTTNVSISGASSPLLVMGSVGDTNVSISGNSINPSIRFMTSGSTSIAAIADMTHPSVTLRGAGGNYLTLIGGPGTTNLAFAGNGPGSQLILGSSSDSTNFSIVTGSTPSFTMRHLANTNIHASGGSSPSLLFRGTDPIINIMSAASTNISLGVNAGSTLVTLDGSNPSFNINSIGTTNFELRVFGSQPTMLVNGSQPAINVVSSGTTNFSLGVNGSSPFATLNGSQPAFNMVESGTTNFRMSVNASTPSFVMNGSQPSISLVNSGTTNIEFSVNSGNSIIMSRGISTTNLYSDGIVTYGHSGIQTNNAYDLINRASADVRYLQSTATNGLQITNSAINNLVSGSVVQVTDLIATNAVLFNVTNVNMTVTNMSGSNIVSALGTIGILTANIIRDSGGIASIDVSNRYLKASNGANTVDYQSRTLNDLADVLAVQWGSRTLNNASGTAVLDWSGSSVAMNGMSVTNIQTNNIVGLGSYIALLAYPLASNPSNYVTASITNGYGSVVYQNSNTVNVSGTFVGNGLGMTNIQTNNVVGLGSYIGLLAYPLASNPSNYVTASITNGYSLIVYSNASAFAKLDENNAYTSTNTFSSNVNVNGTFSLTNRSAAPTGSSGQVCVISDKLYVYDSSRSKFLSVHEVAFQYGLAGNVNGVAVQQFAGGVVSLSSGGVLRHNGTLVGMSGAYSSLASTKSVNVYTNGVLAFSVTNSTLTWSTNGVNLDVSSNITIQVESATANSTANPTTILYFKYRP